MESSVLTTCLALLFLNCVQWASAEAAIVSPPQTVGVYTGQTAVLKCQVDNLSSKIVSWTFVSKDITIFEGNKAMTDDPVKYSIISTPDGGVHNLQILGVEEMDQGFYRCAIDGTDEYITSYLDVFELPETPVGEAPPINVTDCCVAEGIPSTCLPVCQPDQVDFSQFDALLSCGSENILRGLLKCLANGRNHDSCCLNSKVDPMCLGFCHNEIPSDLSLNHLTTCYSNQNNSEAIFNCFKVGFEFLPSEPREFYAVPFNNGKASVLLKWKKPQDNPHTVTGYKIMYRSEGETTYKSVVIKNAVTFQYTLTEDREKIVPNTGYDIHVAALANHGVSFGSVEVTVFLPNASRQEDLNKNIDACCQTRGVSEECRGLLCRSKTWSNFQSSDVLKCWSYVDDVFTCLVGEQDHSNCCEAFDVTSECQPICTGNPPPFNSSLISCVSQMGVIEACVQNNNGVLPTPPSRVRLVTVQSDSAVLEFEPSSSSGIVAYVWQIKNEETAPFRDYNRTTPTSTVINLENLRPNTYYWIRVVAETSEKGSLPSNTVEFLTYPEDFFGPTPPSVINIPHNLTECCMESGMPEVCWRGCTYSPNMTAYYGQHLMTCAIHIGSVLSCASDGRDHTDCCERRDMSEKCQSLCRMTTRGPLESSLTTCVGETSSAVLCFIEGIVDLPRHPDVVVTNVSISTISLDWEQPKTSGKIDKYYIYYGETGKPQQNVSTPQTGYILQDLKPGTAYEIEVVSENENGTSVPSPVITVFTHEKEDTYPEVNITVETGRAYWNNISHCCENQVSASCLAQCLNKQATADETCAPESHKMLACFADGQDHRLCCEKNNLPSVCLPLCGGKALESHITAATCLSYNHRDIILSCFLERQGLIPNAPQQFVLSLTSNGLIQLSWGVPGFCGDSCTYYIHYWKKDQMSDVKTLEDVKSPYVVVDPLVKGDSYTFTVSARNSYGSGPPSEWQTILYETYAKAVKVTLQSDKEYVETGQPAALRCAWSDFNPADPPRLEWHLNGRKLSTTSRNLAINSVDPSTDEGFYTCSVIDSVTTSSDSLYLPIKYAPKFDQLSTDQVRPGIGEQGKIACWFKGYPDSDPEMWYKDGQPIRRDITKYSMQRDDRYHTGITSYRIKIADVVEADYGNYHIDVSNKYGKGSCKVAFKNPDELDNVTPAKKETDPMMCCKNAGVSQLCQRFCSFDVDLTGVINDMQYLSCLAYFETYIQCGADGRDHSKCCYDSGVNPSCVPLCSAVVPTVDPIVCLEDTDTIFGCAQKGHKNLPFPPENVILRKRNNDRSILVAWSQPTYLHDKVDHYSIYYNYTDHEEPVSVHVNHVIQEYTIENITPRATYNVWVVAGNKNGNSQPSDIAIIKTLDFPTNLMASRLADTADVNLSWDMGPDSTYDKYMVFYKKLNDARFKMDVVTTRYHRLTGLDPNTKYVAYVKAGSGSDVSAESDQIHFTTGTGTGPGTGAQDGDDDDDDDKKVAIGVGVTVAIIALIAIIFLVLFFVYRSRMSKTNLNDAVAFENPGFGDGQIKMHGVDESFNYGRLEEDNPTSGSNNTYDNVAANGDAMENPPSQTHQPDYSNSAATLQV